MVRGPAAAGEDHVVHKQGCAAATDEKSDVPFQFGVAHSAAGQLAVGFGDRQFTFCLLAALGLPLRLSEKRIFVYRHHCANERNLLVARNRKRIQLQGQRVRITKCPPQLDGYFGKRLEILVWGVSRFPKFKRFPKAHACYRIDVPVNDGIG